MCWAFTEEYIEAVFMTVMKDNLAKSYLEHMKPDLCRDKDDNTTELCEGKSSVTSLTGNVSV